MSPFVFDKSLALYFLTDEIAFPSPLRSRDDGLLAVGGDLSVERLLLAYSLGIFPWYDDESPILWWSPDPRLVLYPQELVISKSLRKVLKKDIFQVTMDTVFEQIMTACAQIPRRHEQGTWITDEMIQAYTRLHHAGYAHSVEVWRDSELVGGLYGVSLGRCFFGESMFSRQSNASKVALCALVDYLTARQFALIDCQVTTAHLLRMGAKEVPKIQFLTELEHALRAPTFSGKWQFTAFANNLSF